MIIKKTEAQLRVINVIKDLRQNQHISQDEIADILKLKSPGQIGSIESPKFVHKYTLKQLKTLCDYFEYPFEKLFLNNEEFLHDENKLISLLIDKIAEYDEKRKNY